MRQSIVRLHLLLPMELEPVLMALVPQNVRYMPLFKRYQKASDYVAELLQEEAARRGVKPPPPRVRLDQPRPKTPRVRL